MHIGTDATLLVAGVGLAVGVGLGLWRRFRSPPPRNDNS